MNSDIGGLTWEKIKLLSRLESDHTLCEVITKPGVHLAQRADDQTNRGKGGRRREI